MIRCLNCMEMYDEQFEVCSHCGFVRGTPPKEIYHLHPGMVLSGRYTIGVVLGFGGFGITYKAWDSMLDKLVAIKEFYPSGIVNRIPGESEVIIYTGDRASEFYKGKERFLMEAQNMAKFNTHPNIVNVYDFFESNNTAYIAMEFLDGISYKQYIASNGGLVETQTALEVVLSVLDALREIHKCKIIHRDLSPDNIFICQDGRIKLIDFGAARFSTGEEEKTMSIILKPGYAPPEQYRSKSRQGPWTDIYALGAVLYRSVTGVMPEESVNRIVEDHLNLPSAINPEIPTYLDNCIMRAMALNQELRFQNVDQFRDALKNQKEVLDVPSELKKRKKTRALELAAVGIVILIAGLFTFRSFIGKRQEANLSQAQIDVWFAVKDGEMNQEEEFSRMFEEFLAVYDNKITINLEGIPESDYENRLRTALESSKGPDIFDSSCLEREDRKYLASMDASYELLNSEEYYFLEEFKQSDKEMKQIPLSFQVPVVYANTFLVTPPKTIASLDQLKVDEKLSYSVNSLNKAGYEALFNIGMTDLGYEAFEKRETAYYLGDTSDYTRVQQDFAGTYQIVLPDHENLTGRFTDLWSVNEASPKDEKAAALRLAYYFLSETSQDIYNVQNSHGIPLNKKIYDMYAETNSDFAELSNCFAELSFSFDNK